MGVEEESLKGDGSDENGFTSSTGEDGLDIEFRRAKDSYKVGKEETRKCDREGSSTPVFRGMGKVKLLKED